MEKIYTYFRSNASRPGHRLNQNVKRPRSHVKRHWGTIPASLPKFFSIC
ncbi:Uncharacterized protein dnm_097280 [Desulfonema magnum]|uniref:Uncharacterized protein n=1 Tax=Desulfonema magnum TaxID=45655 RepID=A0A975BZJ9_9BACT|nr:Uncharacterized protein dnm_097280 [Desulfonema magnum]